MLRRIACLMKQDSRIQIKVLGRKTTLIGLFGDLLLSLPYDFAAACER